MGLPGLLGFHGPNKPVSSVIHDIHPSAAPARCVQEIAAHNHPRCATHHCGVHQCLAFSLFLSNTTSLDRRKCSLLVVTSSGGQPFLNNGASAADVAAHCGRAAPLLADPLSQLPPTCRQCRCPLHVFVAPVCRSHESTGMAVMITTLMLPTAKARPDQPWPNTRMSLPTATTTRANIAGHVHVRLAGKGQGKFLQEP